MSFDNLTLIGMVLTGLLTIVSLAIALSNDKATELRRRERACQGC
jgi:hypothetical protein